MADEYQVIREDESEYLDDQIVSKMRAEQLALSANKLEQAIGSDLSPYMPYKLVCFTMSNNAITHCGRDTREEEFAYSPTRPFITCKKCKDLM